MVQVVVASSGFFLAKFAFGVIPQDPAKTECRYGITLEDDYKHWFLPSSSRHGRQCTDVVEASWNKNSGCVLFQSGYLPASTRSSSSTMRGVRTLRSPRTSRTKLSARISSG